MIVGEDIEMSGAEHLYITSKGDDVTTVYLGKYAAAELFDYMLPRLQQLAPDYSDKFEGEYYGSVLSIAGIPGASYLATYQLIMQACDQIDCLKPFKSILNEVLQADPRFGNDSLPERTITPDSV